MVSLHLGLVARSKYFNKVGEYFAYLHALNLEFHVVFSGGFAIFPFLPTVSIAPITHFLARIEEHGTTFGSGEKKERATRFNKKND